MGWCACAGVDGCAGCAHNGSVECAQVGNRYGGVARCNGKVTDWVRGAPNINHAHKRKEVFVYARNICYICGS